MTHILKAFLLGRPGDEITLLPSGAQPARLYINSVALREFIQTHVLYTIPPFNTRPSYKFLLYWLKNLNSNRKVTVLPNECRQYVYDGFGRFLKNKALSAYCPTCAEKTSDLITSIIDNKTGSRSVQTSVSFSCRNYHVVYSTQHSLHID